MTQFKRQLKEFLQKEYVNSDSFLENVIFPVFGKDNFESAGNDNLLKRHPELQPKAVAAGILSLTSVGQLFVEGSELGIYDVTLDFKKQLARNRVGIQQIIRSIISTHSGAFIIFHYQSGARWEWRFTFCYKGANNIDSSDTKRYTFLLGPGQSCRTAAENFGTIHEKITQNGVFEMRDVITAFDVEALSKEFFNKYKSHYEDIIEYITGKRMVKEGSKWVEKVTAEPCPEIMQEFASFPNPEKAVRDYVKKLMGRMVFIQFLQKKGWMGCPAGEEWGDGDNLFLQHLYDNTTHQDTFVDNVLEPLFNDINTKRPNDRASEWSKSFPLGGNEGGFKVPYLNGGLFERDDYDKTAFPLPGRFIKGILDFFAAYNFTIDENDPNDAQVGVDPEMLSRIFENLLEDNKDKGAYYTPKEIVQYMCRESLIAYLQTDVTDEGEKDTIRQFVTTYDGSLLAEEQKSTIDEKLQKVKICAPAIGSGAFPMGMLRELFFCRSAVEGLEDKQASEIKKHIIRKNIYGVDIEKGAVDIARLRFWLTLVIDEETPHALPNLDFKIMQGNSLLEQYEGVNLSGIAKGQALGNASKKRIIKSESDRKGKKGLDNSLQMGLLFDKAAAIRNIQSNLSAYYSQDDHSKRQVMREAINAAVHEYIKETLPPNSPIINEVDDLPLENDKFFLWHTWFSEVFEDGGFDIVIGNPPYVEAKKLKGIASRLKGYEVYSGTADFSIYFLEQGLNLCKEGGCLYFITTNKFFNTGYGKKVRKMILNKNVSHIVNFEQVEVFEDILVSSVILGINNSAAVEGNAIPFKQYYKLNNKEFKAQFSGIINDYDAYPQNALDESEWSFSDAEQLLLKQKIENGHTLLGDTQGVAIYRGVTTGYNPAFIINNVQKDELIAKDARNAEVIKNMLQGRNVRKWYYNESDENLVQTGYDTDIQNDYPDIYYHLYQFYESMVARSDQGKKWWNLRACQYYSEFEQDEKIIWGLTADKWAYTTDEAKHYLPSNGYILTSKVIPIKYILGVLNSDLLKYYFSFIGVMTAGGAYTLKAATISALPFYVAENMQPIIDVVDEILKKKAANHDADITDEETRLNDLVYELYGITDYEKYVIFANLIEISEVIAADVNDIQERPSRRNVKTSQYIINDETLYDWIIRTECTSIADVQRYINDNGFNDNVICL